MVAAKAPQPVKQPTLARSDQFLGSGSLVGLAHNLVVQLFGESNWQAFYNIVSNESGWVVGRMNTTCQAAYGYRPDLCATGLGQAYPGTKMGSSCIGNAECELRWTIGYIQERYQTPNNALAYWQKEKSY